MVYKSGQIFLTFCHNPRVWRTDRQRILLAIPRLHYMQRGKNEHLSSANFPNGNIVLKECTHSMNNKIKLYILGVPMNKW